MTQCNALKLIFGRLHSTASLSQLWKPTPVYSTEEGCLLTAWYPMYQKGLNLLCGIQRAEQDFD